MTSTDIEEDEKGKLFVGALSWETTDESLHRYFSRFGKVTDCVVMTNQESGRSRGFGFVTFADPNNVNYVLQNGPHTLDGRTIDPKPCNPRSMKKPRSNNKLGPYPKIFLGGLPSNITETDLRTFFSRYGKVVEVVIMYDQEKKKSRGFGFLSFEDEASVERVTSEHYINLNGKQVEIKKAEPRDIPTTRTSNRTNNDAHQQWNHPPQGIPGVRSMGTASNMIQSYQGWNTSQQSYGYTGPNPPSASFQGWTGPPPPPPLHTWTSFAATPSTQGFGSYAATGTSGGANWMWSQSPTTNNVGLDIYSRQQVSLTVPPSTTQPTTVLPPTGPLNTTKLQTDYTGYGAAPLYGIYLNELASSSYGQPSSTYGNDNSLSHLYQASQIQGNGF